MRHCRLRREAAALLGALAVALPALAQSQQQERTSRYNAIVDNLDVLVENYTRFLARKYDLTDEQSEYTKYLLRERAYDFFSQHEDEVRDLLDRLFEVRTGGEMTQEELIAWGLRVKPIYEEAKQLIIDGNEEWRQILTDEQKKIHDEDLALMYESFATTEDQIERIVSGQMTVEEFRTPQRSRRPRTTTPQRPTPPEPPEPSDEGPAVSPVKPGRSTGGATRKPQILGGDERTPAPEARTGAPGREPTRPRVTPPGRQHPPAGGQARTVRRGEIRGKTAKSGSPKGFEGQWDQYVRNFIAKYQLNDEQVQKAQAVLEDCKAQANRYLRSRKTQIEQLDNQIEEVKKSKDKNKAKSLAGLNDKRKKLMEPIDRIFEHQLKPRLERLPTRAQRQAAKQAAKKKPAPKRQSEPEQKKKEEPAPQP